MSAPFHALHPGCKSWTQSRLVVGNLSFFLFSRQAPRHGWPGNQPTISSDLSALPAPCCLVQHQSKVMFSVELPVKQLALQTSHKTCDSETVGCQACSPHLVACNISAAVYIQQCAHSMMHRLLPAACPDAQASASGSGSDPKLLIHSSDSESKSPVSELSRPTMRQYWAIA